MASITSNLDLISASQKKKEITANELFNAASPSMLFGRRASTCSGLTWGYYGGVLSVSGTLTTINNGTVTLSASSTNYIESTTSGVVSKNTSAFTSGAIPLYTATTSASDVTAYTDYRTGSYGGNGVGSLPVSGTAGQVLVKVNSTDYNASWQTPIAQFNPIAGTNVTLSGTYPNITFNASGGGGTVYGGSFTQYAVVVGHTPNTTVRTIASLGTTTTVLHGNASGDPTWGSVNLATDVSGNLPVTRLNSGNNAISSNFWRGDGTWAAVPAGVNLLHNSNFLINYGSLSYVYSAGSTVALPICPGWALVCNGNISVSFPSTGLRLVNSTGSTIDIDLIQVLEPAESRRFASGSFITSGVVRIDSGGFCNMYTSVKYMTTGVDTTAYYLNSAPSGTVTFMGATSINNSGMSNVVANISSSINLPTLTQIAIVHQFRTTANRTIDIQGLFCTYGTSPVYLDQKSVATCRVESNRTWQKVGAFLTTSYISIPIYMRAIPTVTLTPNPSSGFDTTGTTKDALIIAINSGVDDGVYSIDLKAEY